MYMYFPGFKYSDWERTIDRYINQAKKQQLHCNENIPITQQEINYIKSIKNSKLEKLYFTLLCISKLKNIRNEYNNNWVSEAETEIFKLANVSNKNAADRASMLYALYSSGFISYATKVDNLNIRVEKICNDSEDIAFYITDLRELGYQYMHYCGEKFVKCLECGRFVRQSRNGRVKYCKSCAETVNRRLSIGRYKCNQSD